MKAKFFIDMPTPAGVKDDGFALYDSGEQRLRWSVPFPLPAIGVSIYITMNSIGWAVEGFFAEDGYLGVMTKAENPRGGSASRGSERRAAIRPRLPSGSSLASAVSSVRKSRWNNHGCTATDKDSMTARFVPPFKSRRRSLESFGLRTIFARRAGRSIPCLPMNQTPRCAAAAASRFTE